MPTDCETSRALVCVPRAGQDWETEVTIARLRNSGLGPGRRPAGTPASITIEAAQPLLAGMTPRKVSDGVSGSLADENYRLGGGDRLRIRFYDRHDRDDLNGEYLISESGQLRLPRIGVYAARDKKVGELEREIRRSVESRGGRLGYFTIDVTQCRPFYVAGLANCPGAYPYVPGHTVLHAVSVAGGLYRAPLESATGSMREKRILTETMDRIAELMARRARLEAERDDAGAIRVPEELAELEPLRAAELIASETSLLCRSREAAKRERAGLESVIQLAIAEFESHRASLARMEERIQEQTAAFGRLRTLHRQGRDRRTPAFRGSGQPQRRRTRQAGSVCWTYARHGRSPKGPEGAFLAGTFRQRPRRRGNRPDRPGNCPAQSRGRRNAAACHGARYAVRPGRGRTNSHLQDHAARQIRRTILRAGH